MVVTNLPILKNTDFVANIITHTKKNSLSQLEIIAHQIFQSNA